MQPNTEPNPEFVRYLEGELASAWRRRQTVQPQRLAVRMNRRRRGAVLGLVLLSTVLGGAGTFAVTQMVEAEVVRLSLARREALVEIAKSRLEFAVRRMESVREGFAQDLVSIREFARMQLEVAEAEMELAVRESELNEARITGREPDDDLTAPSIKGHDFVTERLELRRDPLARRVVSAADHFERMEKLRATGQVSFSEAEAVRFALLEAELALRNLDEQMTLRKLVLAGNLTDDQAALRVMRIAAQTTRERAVHRVELCASRHARISSLVARGRARGAEALDAESELRAAEGALQLAELELAIIDRKLSVK
jgi:hypothetical protein